MNPEVKALLKNALLSGEYKQGFYFLNPREGEYCCLGVLCELAKDAGIIKRYYSLMEIPPKEVRDWAGLSFTEIGKLTHFNDDMQLSFAEIAEKLKYLEILREN
jgi:hypothetical protein